VNISEYLKMLPEITEVNRPYWEGCEVGELRLQTCIHCGFCRYPDSELCPRCLSHEWAWRKVSGKGRVWSWVVVHQKYFEAFADELPYTVLLVELDEGPRIISGLVGEARRLRIDQPVEVVFTRVANERSIPKFRIVQ